MAEQISHKKSLRVKRLGDDKKRLLKEYYKLEENTNDMITPADTSMEQDANETNNGTSDKEMETGNTDDEGGPQDNNRANDREKDTRDRPINELTLQQLVQIHNRLVGQEIEMGNSIKNTIYDNYYDLVKVNTLLQNIVQRDATSPITRNLNKLEALTKP